MENNLANIDSVVITEFYESLNKLYKITTEYRNALREGSQEDFNKSSKELVSALQEQYYFYEKNSLSNKYLADKANSLVMQFNMFVPYYNEYSNSTDRTSAIAQIYARKAESMFKCLVEMVVAYIDELKPYIHKIEQVEQEKPIFPEKPLQINNNIDLKIDMKIDISVSIKMAEQKVENSDLDEDTKKEVLQKLDELKQLSEERNNKKRFGEKLKNILKWVAEQTIQVAAIVVPIVTNLLG